jgi:hypothetical protein
MLVTMLTVCDSVLCIAGLQQWRDHSQKAIQRSNASTISVQKAKQYCTAKALLAWHALTIQHCNARTAYSARALMTFVLQQWRFNAIAEAAARDSRVVAAVAKAHSKVAAQCFAQWHRYTTLQRLVQQAAAVACISQQRRSVTIAYKHWLHTAKVAVVHNTALIADVRRRSNTRLLYTVVRDWRRVTAVCRAARLTEKAFAAWQVAAVAQCTARQQLNTKAITVYSSRLQQRCLLAWSSWLAQLRALQHTAALVTATIQRQRTAVVLQQWRAAASVAVDRDAVLIARIQQRVGLRMLRTVLQQWRQLTCVLLPQARVAVAFRAWQISAGTQRCTRATLCDTAVKAHNSKQLQQCLTAWYSWLQQRKTVRRAAAAVIRCINKHCCGSAWKQWRALAAQQSARYAALTATMQQRIALRTLRTVLYSWRQLTRALVTQARLAAAFSAWQLSVATQVTCRSTACATAVTQHARKLQQQCFKVWQQWLAEQLQAVTVVDLQHAALVSRMQKRSAGRSAHAVLSAWWRVTVADVAYCQRLKQRFLLQWCRYTAARSAQAQRLHLACTHLRLRELGYGLTALKRWQLQRAQRKFHSATAAAKVQQHAVHRRAVAVTHAMRFWRSEAAAQQRLAEYLTQRQSRQLRYALRRMKARCAHGRVTQRSALQAHCNKVKSSAVMTWRHVVSHRANVRNLSAQQYKLTLLVRTLRQWCTTVNSTKHQRQQLVAAAQAHVAYSERTASHCCKRAVQQWHQHAQARAFAKEHHTTAAAHSRRALLVKTLQRWLQYVQQQCTLRLAEAHHSTTAARAALCRWQKLQQQARHFRLGSTADLLRLYTGLRRWAVYSAEQSQFRTRCTEGAQKQLIVQQQRALALWRARVVTAVDCRSRCERAVGEAQQLWLQRGLRKWCVQCKLIAQQQRDSGLGSIKAQSERGAAALLALQQRRLR